MIKEIIYLDADDVIALMQSNTVVLDNYRIVIDFSTATNVDLIHIRRLIRRRQKKGTSG